MSNVKTAEAVINVTNNREVADAIRTLKEARAAIKAAEDAKSAAEKIIREAASGRVGLSFVIRGIVAAKISDERVRRSNDAKVLQEAFPEAYAASLRETTYSQISVS
jgi:hypothetical protein